MAGVSHDHFKPDRGRQPYSVAHPYLLPVRNDPVRAVDITAHEILEHVVTVEAAPTLSELGDPRPDIVCSSVNSDCPSRHEIRARHEVIARHRARDLLIRCTPPELPG